MYVRFKLEPDARIHIWGDLLTQVIMLQTTHFRTCKHHLVCRHHTSELLIAMPLASVCAQATLHPRPSKAQRHVLLPSRQPQLFTAESQLRDAVCTHTSCNGHAT